MRQLFPVWLGFSQVETKSEGLMSRKILTASLLALLLSACNVASSLNEGVSHAELAATEIGKRIGNKPKIGFQYMNGELRSVTVVFQVTPTIPVDEIEKVARKEVIEAFRAEPGTLVLSFVYAKPV